MWLSGWAPPTTGISQQVGSFSEQVWGDSTSVVIAGEVMLPAGQVTPAVGDTAAGCGLGWSDTPGVRTLPGCGYGGGCWVPAWFRWPEVNCPGGARIPSPMPLDTSG